MVDMQLLQFARSRDDQDFVWRVAAAVTLQAQYNVGAGVTGSVESKKLDDYVMENPLVSIPTMVAFVATNEAVAANVVIEDGRVDTSGVLDNDIKYAVGANWETVAKQMFLVTAE